MTISTKHQALLIRLLIAGGILVILAMGAYLLTSSMDSSTTTSEGVPTSAATTSVSGWQIYRDSTDGYAIQYPPALRLLSEDSAGDGVTVYPAATPLNYAASQGLNFTPLIIRPTNETLWEFAHNTTPTPPGLDDDTVISINGISSYSFDLTFGRIVIDHVFLFKDSDHGIDATYDAESPLASSYRAVLGTFTFATTTPVNL